MRIPDSTIATCLRLGLACAALLCALPAQGALWLRRGDLVQAQPIDTSVRAAIERLCAGPSAGERAQGLESAVPAGTRLVEARTEGTALTLVFDEPLLLAAADNSAPSLVPSDEAGGLWLGGACGAGDVCADVDAGSDDEE